MCVRWTALGAALSLLAPGCRREHGMSFQEFVATTVELRQAASGGSTPAAFAARKRAIEARHHVTDADLDRYVRDHAGDVKLLAAAWDSVEARLGRAAARDTAARTPRAPHPVVPATGTASPASGGGTPPRPHPMPRF